MFIVTIDEDKCTGCNICPEGCPAKILDFTGAKAVVKGDASECLGCEYCVIVCPAEAISIMEV